MYIGSGTYANYLEANFIGTDRCDTSDLGNRQDGVLVDNAAMNAIGMNGASPVPAERNVISGNSGNGVHITGSQAIANTVSGDYIGTDSGGSSSIGNSLDGVLIDGGANSNYVGVNNLTSASYLGVQANFISGNAGNGVRISGSAYRNFVSGNYIGVAANCSTPMGNLQGGIRIEGGSDNNVVGADPTLAAVDFVMANTIAWNGSAPASGQTGAGVAVVSDQAVCNSILANSIFGNSGLGIDLGDDGPTPNSGQFSMFGPNSWQNSPLINNIVDNGNGTSTVYGTLAADPSSSFRLELFWNNGNDAKWNSEGTSFLADSSVTTDANGNFQLVIGGTPQYQCVTATATYNYSTSEFTCYVGAKTKIVTYDATNTAEFHQIASDPFAGAAGVAYSRSNQWQNNSLDAGSDGVPKDFLDHQYPLCYTRSGTAAGNVLMTTNVNIHVSVAPPNGSVMVCATGGGAGYSFTMSQPTGSNATFTPNGANGGYITASLQSNALPSVITQFALLLNWSVSVDGGKTWLPAGVTQNQIYVTWDNPTNLKSGGGVNLGGGGVDIGGGVIAPYLTVLSVGCNAGNNTAPASATAAAAQIFTTFSTRNVTRGWDNDALLAEQVPGRHF